MLRFLYTPDPLPEPPVPPSPALLEAIQKAIDTPDSLTPADKRLILERLPEDQENARCKTPCGLTMPELLQKAIQQPDELTGDEADIVVWGPDHLTTSADTDLSADTEFWWLRQSEEVRQKRYAASVIAESETENAARLNAQRRREAALARLSDHDKRNIRYAQMLPWISDLEVQGLPQWGFMLFRTSYADDSGWQTFKEQFLDATATAFSQVRRSAQISQKWKIQWIEDKSLEGASLSDLCRHFRTLSSNKCEAQILPGLHRDAFLYADADAIASATLHSPLPDRGYVCAADATYDESKLEDYRHGFAGVLRVALTHVFTTFHARLVNRGDPLEDPAATRGLRQSWDLMYYKSRYDAENRVYPPASTINR